MSKRILLVDDEPDIMAIFKQTLERSGYEVVGYTDPLKALENFKASYFDLLMFDFKMNNLNGFELYEKIRRIDNNAKICFLSADESHYKEYQDHMPQLAADRFLHKPISTRELAIRIKKILE